MAVIGATQLEPVNILGSYVQGMELGRANRLAQQQQAAQMQAAQQEAALRNYLSTADLESPEAQNQLLRFGAPGATLAKTLGEMRSADLTRQKTMTDIEAAGFKRERDLLASVNDQSTYDTWRQGALQTYKGVPGAEQLIPAKFSPETKERLLLTADQIVGRMPMSPEQEAQKTRIAAAGAPRTSISTKGDTAEEVKKAESRVAEYNTIRDRAVQGRRTLPSLQRAASALEKFETGFGSEAATEARRVLVSFGLADAEAAEKVQSADAFAVAVKDRILFKLSQQAGTQTEGDAQRAEDTWASFRKLTDSNKFLIDLEKAVIAQDNEQLKFYDDWEAKNGTYRGAAQAWRDGPGNQSLFDRPELKKYADRESAAESAANPVRVKTVAEAEKLAPGTVFITPDGRRKVR
jgi:hypothetical protein